MSIIIQRRAHYLDFPQELSSHVFETLQNDSSSLKHCSLVCRAWLHATRTHLFRQVILTPQNIESFTFFIIDSRSTVPPHVRKLELRNIDCSNKFLADFMSNLGLTHLHLRDMTFNAFIDILDIICLFPCLQSVALDGLTIQKSSVEKSACIKNKVLPASVNSVRCRGEYLRTFILWLLQHDKIPKLSNLDIGPVKDQSIFDIGKYLVFVGPAMKHLSFSFEFDHDAQTCGLHNHGTQTAEQSEFLSIAKRYKAVFGIETCPDLARLTGLQSLRLDNFIHFEHLIHGNALVWGPRVLASSRSRELREVILVVSLRRAGELDKFNMRWDFLDEAFSSIDGPYANLLSLKFEITGRVKIDGTANLIRSRLPGCEKRGLLKFCRGN